MKKLHLMFLCLIVALSTKSWAGEYDQPQEQAGELLIEISNLDGIIFQGSGVLKKSWMQMDENDPRYVVQIGNRKYPINLDDGRGTSQRAAQCGEEEFIGMNPNRGCPVTFEAEYNIALNDGTVDIELTVWNVQFQ